MTPPPTTLPALLGARNTPGIPSSSRLGSVAADGVLGHEATPYTLLVPTAIRPFSRGAARAVLRNGRFAADNSRRPRGCGAAAAAVSLLHDERTSPRAATTVHDRRAARLSDARRDVLDRRSRSIRRA